MDMNTKAKSKVLQDLIDMMDSKMTEGLRSKSPKFAKVDIQSDDPELAESLKDKLVDGISEEDGNEDPMQEMSKADFKEDMQEGETSFNENDHKSEDEDPEDMARLLEMYKKLK